MSKSIFSRYAVPFFQWYAVMILLTIIIDYFLHRYKFTLAGRYLGYTGTALILISFIYSLRKRKIIKSGSPKKLLSLHEYLAWAGSVMVLVHAGIHFNALLPWLAVFMLLVVVASGLVGKFLLQKSNETLKEKREILISSGLSLQEADNKLFFDSVTVDLMKKWRSIHMPVTIILFVLVLIHVVTIVMFTK